MILLSGCGDGWIPVRGTVTLDGKPVDDGSVSFQPPDGNGPTAGASVKAGQFEVLTGLKPGTYKVTVRGVVKTGRQQPAGPPLPPGTMIDEMVMYPPTGQNPEPVTVEVKVGEPPLTFDLKSLPPAKK